MKRQRSIERLTAAVMLFGFTILVYAVDVMPAPLPSFQITRADGTSMATSDLSQTGKWLLLYTKSDCVGCDELLKLINKTESPDVPVRLVVIVAGATPERLKQIAGKFPDLQDSLWFSDPSRDGLDTLKLPGVPAVFGVRGDVLVWCVIGALDGDSLKMKSILADWIRE